MRQVPPRARPGGTASGVTSPGNTAEPSRELPARDLVAAGNVLPAAGRAADWVPVSEPLTEVRTREHGTRPPPGRFPGSGDRAPVPSPDQGAT